MPNEKGYPSNSHRLIEIHLRPSQLHCFTFFVYCGFDGSGCGQRWRHENSVIQIRVVGHRRKSKAVHSTSGNIAILIRLQTIAERWHFHCVASVRHGVRDSDVVGGRMLIAYPATVNPRDVNRVRLTIVECAHLAHRLMFVVFCLERAGNVAPAAVSGDIGNGHHGVVQCARH